MTALLKRRLLVSTFAILFLLFGLFAPFQQTITAYCQVEAAHQWSLRHYGSRMIAAEWDINLTGRDTESLYFQIDQPDISKIDVAPSMSPGTHVKRNEVVATIQSLRGKNQLLIGEATLEREIQRRVAMESGGRPEDIAIEQRRVERDSVELAGYELEFARLQSLYEAEGLSEAEYESAESKLAELSTEFELSKARLAASLVGVHQEKLKMQDSEVKRLMAEVEGLRESYGSSQEILSPLDGVVSQKNDPHSLLVIQDMDTLALRVVFPESFAAYLESGMTVDVYFPSHPDKSIPVTLDQFGFYGGDTTATYGLGMVDNRELNLLPGMHGTAELPIGRITLVERIRNVMLIGNN